MLSLHNDLQTTTAKGFFMFIQDSSSFSKRFTLSLNEVWMGVKDKKENLEFQLFKNTHFILNDTQKNALLSFHRCQVLLSKKIQRSNRTMLTEISINEWKIINIKGASTSKKESLNDKPDFIDSKKTYVKDYQVAAGQKVRLIYCLKEKKNTCLSDKPSWGTSADSRTWSS